MAVPTPFGSELPAKRTSTAADKKEDSSPPEGQDDGDGRPGKASSSSSGGSWQYQPRRKLELRSKSLLAKIDSLSRAGDELDPALYLDAFKALSKAAIATHERAANQRAAGVYLDQALRLLTQMRERGSETTAEMYVELLSLCKSARESDWALELLQQMDELGLRPDKTCFELVTVVCAKCQNVKWAVRLCAEMEQRGMQPSLDVFNTVLMSCSRQQNWKTVLKMLKLREAKGEGELPDQESYSHVLRTVGQNSDWQGSVSLLARARERELPSLENAAYSAAMDACSRCTKWELAVDIFDLMETEGPEPDQFTLAAAARACEAGSDKEAAQGLQERRVRVRNLEIEEAARAAREEGLSGMSWRLVRRGRPRIQPSAYPGFDSD